MEQLVTPPKEGKRTIEEAPNLPNKYSYPEFAGWNGELYLKKLLRQILPMALYRTWEIFTDHQAIGNVCYLSVPRLAEMAGRSIRTIEKNLASLCAKHLLVERAERKVFCSPAGVVKSRVVIIKDFAGLYALAHEYHEWLNAEEYIAPDREMLALLQASPKLVAKLRRFENYRKVLYNKLPGPFSQVREKDRWFTEYQAESYFTTTENGQAKEAKQPRSLALPAKDSTTSLAHDLASSSVQRITKTTPINRPEGDPFDSARTFPSEHSLKDGEHTETLDGQQISPSLTLDTRGREKQEAYAHMSLAPSPAVQKELPDPQRKMQERTETPGVLTQAGQVEAKIVLEQTYRSWSGRDDQTMHSCLLTRSFVREIAAPFGDLNPQGTQTHMLSVLQKAHLDQPADVLACLIRAYVVARDTRAIRPEHCHPETGRANRMPLFCTLFRRFVEAHTRRKMRDCSWQQMQEEIAGDGRLTHWWQGHRYLIGTCTSAAFNAPDDKQNPPGVCFPINVPELAPYGSHTPLRPTHHQPCSQNHRTLASTSGGTGGSPTHQSLSPQQPNQYERYVNALITQYSAPVVFQEVQ